MTTDYISKECKVKFKPIVAKLMIGMKIDGGEQLTNTKRFEKWQHKYSTLLVTIYYQCCKQLRKHGKDPSWKCNIYDVFCLCRKEYGDFKADSNIRLCAAAAICAWDMKTWENRFKPVMVLHKSYSPGDYARRMFYIVDNYMENPERKRLLKRVDNF